METPRKSITMGGVAEYPMTTFMCQRLIKLHEGVINTRSRVALAIAFSVKGIMQYRTRIEFEGFQYAQTRACAKKNC